MQIIKNYILLTLMIGITVPTLVAQDETIDYGLSGVSNIVLALNRLESKKAKSSETAKAMYENLGFSKAAALYKNEALLEKSNKEVWSKLGNAARLNADYEEAVYWYERVIADGPVPMDILYYAQALQATGNCKEAIRWFSLYNASPATEKVSFINDCSDIESFFNFEEVSMRNLEGLNSENLEFSAQPYKDGIVFTSNRKSNKFSRLIDNWTSNNFTDLYYSKKIGDSFSKPKVLKGGVNGKFHDGVATFSEDGSMMYFTRNDKSSKAESGTKNLKIYAVSNGNAVKWSMAEELPFNSNEFSSCHPTVTQDGNTMYFSSDRPGGFGGMDIYSTTKSNDSWSTPVNMGPSINTAGNEVFPFVTTEGDVAFSSNGHPGLGGLDVYVARQSTETKKWDRMVNAGQPFNSEKDDFGFYMDSENNKGYISSGRTGQTGNDDIYAWQSEAAVDFFPILSFEQNFCVVEKGTKTPLKNTNIKVEQNEDQETNQMDLKTDQFGMFSVTVWPNTKLAMDLKKDGFLNNVENWSTTMTKAETSSCVYLEMAKEEVVTLKGIIVDASNNDSPMNNAEITIINKCTDKEQKLKSNAKGMFEVKIPCDCDYRVVGSKKTFVKHSKSIKTGNANCSQTKDVKLVLRKPAKPVPVVAPTPTFNNKRLEVGAIIALQNINYDFNKATIRSDAAVELDKVVKLLNTYPNLNIELGAHTDARGSDDYNLSLSGKRAFSARQYLLDKGIPQERITSKGYGETQLLNACQNNIKCSEIDHEYNRRTEIKVVKF